MRYQVMLLIDIDATGKVTWTAVAFRENGTANGYVVYASDPAQDKAIAKLITALKATP